MSVSTAAAESNERMVLRRRPLNAEIWRPYLGAEIEGALAALRRIHAYWKTCTSNPWIAVVPEDDQGLYDTLYHDLFYMLGQRPGMDTLAQELCDLVPETPVDNNLALILDSDVRGDIFDALTRARHALNRILVADGKTFGASPVDALFDIFDAELDMIAMESKASADAMSKQLGLQTDDSRATPSGDRLASKAGRKPAELAFETAQRAFWEVSDALENASEPRRPSHKDVIDHLSESGTAIGTTTFGKRVKAWKAAGQAWPPARPEAME